jgi:hypothetical protein
MLRRDIVSRRRRSRRSYDNDYDRNYDRGSRRGKSAAEARIELMTWAALVGVIALGVLGQDVGLNLPNWFVPFAGATIMLGAGVYQYSRGYRVSPITWLGGMVLGLFLIYALYVDRTQQFSGASLIVFFLVILFGIITGDT